MDATITLKQYLDKGKTFVIPNYQRGYVWGKNRPGEKDSVTYLIDDMLTKFQNQTDLFLQGFTVTEMSDKIVLIDGQQRTTFLFLLFKLLGYTGKFEIKYDVRTKSGNFLRDVDFASLSEQTVPYSDAEIIGEEYQDISFFKKTILILCQKLNGDESNKVDKHSFLQYLIDKVHFLYINVPDEKQAVKVFTMMNGSKAVMLPEEVIKAEILRLASKNTAVETDFYQEWENNLLRSRYAREWDKWLYWWKREDVKTFYYCDNTMGRLITTYLAMHGRDKLTFESFKNLCLNSDTPKQAKETFDGLRNLQKRFEDAFNKVHVHNMIGGILSVYYKSGNDNMLKFIKYYFGDCKCNNLEDYYKMVFLGMTHDEILDIDKSKFTENYNNTYYALNDDNLYHDYAEIAYRFLLRLNIDMDTVQNRMFNFDIWKHRSLEHIFPKSKVWHKNSDGILVNGEDEELKEGGTRIFDELHDIMRDDIEFALEDGVSKYTTTEHGIGNLVLLYKDDNSSFNAGNFLQKKVKFFNPTKEQFKSRTLLHTICVFAELEKWNGESIAINKKKTLGIFENYYCNLKNTYYKENEKEENEDEK